MSKKLGFESLLAASPVAAVALDGECESCDCYDCDFNCEDCDTIPN